MPNKDENWTHSSICLQEIFYGPYFCAEQTTKWYESAEEVPNGPTTKLFQELKSLAR